MEERNYTPKGDWTAASVLAKGELEEEERQPGEDQVGEVGYQECPWRSRWAQYKLTHFWSSSYRESKLSVLCDIITCGTSLLRELVSKYLLWSQLEFCGCNKILQKVKMVRSHASPPTAFVWLYSFLALLKYQFKQFNQMLKYQKFAVVKMCVYWTQYWPCKIIGGCILVIINDKWKVQVQLDSKYLLPYICLVAHTITLDWWPWCFCIDYT